MGLKTDIKLAFLKAKFYFKKGNPFFDDESFFKGKKIIVVGPANTSLDYMSGEEIDKFDFIVRINSSTMTVENLADKIGSRTDILFHCLNNDRFHGQKAFAPELLKKQKTKLVLNVCAVKKTTRKFYQVALDYPQLPLKRLRPSWWNDITKNYKVKFPTTGLVALVFLLKQEFKELHIIGFSFYKTNYVDNYTADPARETALKHIKEYVHHDPNEDFEKFVEEYKREKNKGKNIFLDKTLERLVQEYELERV